MANEGEEIKSRGREKREKTEELRKFIFKNIMLNYKN
jgi:hypothetical protein